jgi:hypothetical protein
MMSLVLVSQILISGCDIVTTQQWSTRQQNLQTKPQTDNTKSSEP